MATVQQIRRVRAQHDADLRSMPNVVAIGTGHRRVKGEQTDELVIVERKLPLDQVAPDARVPRSFRMTIDGSEIDVATDIMETGPFLCASALDRGLVPGKSPYNTKSRPMHPGYSIGFEHTIGKSYGTAGLLVIGDDDNAGYILSNNHVLSPNEVEATKIYQPSLPDGGSSASDGVGDTAYYLPIDPKGINYVDAALASIDDYAMVDPSYPVIGRLKGHYNSLTWNWHLRKVGRTTGLTEMWIDQIEVTTTAGGFSFGSARFDQQVMVRNNGATVLNTGDSGSVAITDDSFAGLLMCTSSPDLTWATGSPVAWAMDAFRVKVWSGGRGDDMIRGESLAGGGDYGNGPERQVVMEAIRGRVVKAAR